MNTNHQTLSFTVTADTHEPITKNTHTFVGGLEAYTEAHLLYACYLAMGMGAEIKLGIVNLEAKV